MPFLQSFIKNDPCNKWKLSVDSRSPDCAYLIRILNQGNHLLSLVPDLHLVAEYCKLMPDIFVWKKFNKIEQPDRGTVFVKDLTELTKNPTECVICLFLAYTNRQSESSATNIRDNLLMGCLRISRVDGNWLTAWIILNSVTTILTNNGKLIIQCKDCCNETMTIKV